ncbi:hypothetical protein [[Eubacterium] cellulosolvens]
MKSWKIGAISGLIAGIVAGVVMVFIASVLPELSLTYWNIEPLARPMPFTYIALIEISNNIIWGILLGVIFSRIYDLIPSKGVFKGLLFGLVLYAFFNVRFACFNYSYNLDLVAISTFLYIHPIVYGLVLGVLYRVPEKKLEIGKHNKLWGVYSGIFASIVFSICVIIYYTAMTVLGIREQPLDIEFLIFQQSAHIVINMFWYGIFGALCAMSYDRIPGKSLMKGLYFGLIFWFITSFRIGVYLVSLGWIEWSYSWAPFAPDLYMIWGIIFYAFYNKRAYIRAFLISIVIFLVGFIWIIATVNLPYIIWGIIRVIIITSLAIILVKISSRSMKNGA